MKRTNKNIKDIDDEKWRWFVGRCIQLNIKVSNKIEEWIDKWKLEEK